jgi:hypothetical protein
MAMSLLNRQELRYFVDETVRLVRSRYAGTDMGDSTAQLLADMLLLSDEIECCVIDVIDLAKAYQRAICYLERSVKLIGGDLQNTITEYIRRVRLAAVSLRQHVTSCIRGMFDPEEKLRALSL